MANEEQLAILKQGAAVWNDWRVQQDPVAATRRYQEEVRLQGLQDDFSDYIRRDFEWHFHIMDAPTGWPKKSS